MKVFTFRVLTDISDAFVRDIEILSNSTFEDFHHALQKAIGLNGKELASFHICDRSWHKQQEITLIDMMAEEAILVEGNGKGKDVFTMKATGLDQMVSETGQRLLYEYDFLNLFTFFLELIRISEIAKGVRYPKVVRKAGTLNILQEEEMKHKGGDDISQKLLDDFKDILKSTYDPGDDDVFESGPFD